VVKVNWLHDNSKETYDSHSSNEILMRLELFIIILYIYLHYCYKFHQMKTFLKLKYLLQIKPFKNTFTQS
jgi:hypothetical protein